MENKSEQTNNKAEEGVNKGEMSIFSLHIGYLGETSIFIIYFASPNKNLGDISQYFQERKRSLLFSVLFYIEKDKTSLRILISKKYNKNRRYVLVQLARTFNFSFSFARNK